MKVGPICQGTPVQGRSVRANSQWNYLGALAALTAAVVTTPIYLSLLGLERFGVLAVLVAIMAPIGVLNAGVTQATVKYVASYSASGELNQARDAVLASLVINTAVGLVGAMACVVAAPVFLGLGFKVSPGIAHDAETALRLTGAVWLLSQIAGVFRGVLEGLRDQSIVVKGDVFQILITAIACVVLASVTRTLQGFVCGQLFAIAVMNVVWFLKAKQGLGGFKIEYHSACRHLRRTYGYSIWHIFNSAVAFIANFADRYFIGLYMSVSSLGAYSVALRLQSACRMMFDSVNQALFPAASAASEVDGAAEMLVLKTTWHVALIAGLGLGWALVIGPTFLRFWVGVEVADVAGPALQILICVLFFEIASAVGSSYLNAKALTRVTSLNNIATTVLTLGTMIPLGARFGLIGVAASGFIGLVMTRPLLHWWMFRRCFRGIVSPTVFFNSFYGVSLSCLASAAVVMPLFSYLIGNNPRLGSFVQANVMVAPIYVFLVFGTILLVLRDGKNLREALSLVKQTGSRFVVRLFGKENC